MEALVQVLANAETPVNIRLFIMRIIDNCQIVFRPYAHHILTPILELLVDECAGSTINHFVADTVSSQQFINLILQNFFTFFIRYYFFIFHFYYRGHNIHFLNHKLY